MVCAILSIECKTLWINNLTLGASRSTEMVDCSQDEPEGLLFITTDPQNLHGCLEFGKLLGGTLLLLSLTDSRGTFLGEYNRFHQKTLSKSYTLI